MDYQVRAHDRVTYTNDLHGELILKMMQLKERVQALETLKTQRLAELTASEARVKRLQRGVQEMDLQNEEIARRNYDMLAQRKDRAAEEIARQMSRQSELQVEKRKLQEYEVKLSAKRQQMAGQAKYDVQCADDKIQAEISLKIGFLKQQAGLSEQIVKIYYTRDEQTAILATLLKTQLELKNGNAYLVMTQMAYIGALSVQNAVYQLVCSETSVLPAESLDQQFLRLIDKKAYNSTYCDDFKPQDEANSRVTYFGTHTTELKDYALLENADARNKAFGGVGAKAQNVSCQIYYYDKDGCIISYFQQLVKPESCVEVRQAPHVNVRYLTEKEKESGSWVHEVEQSEVAAYNQRDFAQFQAQKRAEDSARAAVAAFEQKYSQTPNARNAGLRSPGKQYQTPENLTTIGYSQLVPEIFTPEQQHQLEESIKKQIATTRIAEKQKRERERTHTKRSKSVQLALQRKYLEDAVYTLKNEQNGLRKRLERLYFDRGGDAQLRRAEIAQLKQLLIGGANELKAVKERLARVLILLQMEK